MDLNILFGMITVASLIFGIWAFFKQKEAKEPQCYYKSYKNIEKLTKDESLKVLFNNEEVDRVSTTYVFFWNKGRKPILREDIRKPISLFIVNPTGNEETPIRILDQKVIKTTRNNGLNFLIEPIHEPNRLILSFDFLDKNDGAVIEVKHTGRVDTELKIESTILGVSDEIECKSINRAKLRKVNLYRLYRNIIPRILITSIGMVIVASIFLFSILSFYGQPVWYGIPLASLFVIVIVLIIPWLVRTDLLPLPYPKSLEIYVDFKP